MELRDLTNSPPPPPELPTMADDAFDDELEDLGGSPTGTTLAPKSTGELYRAVAKTKPSPKGGVGHS